VVDARDQHRTLVDALGDGLVRIVEGRPRIGRQLAKALDEQRRALFSCRTINWIDARDLHSQVVAARARRLARV
jgi:hypothetical protein